MGILKKFISFLVIPIPWILKRKLYGWFFHYKLHPASFIGLTWIFVDNLSMEKGSRIGHLTVIKGIHNIQLSEFSRIGNLNWISGFPLNDGSHHFQHQCGSRVPELILGEHTAITNRHLLDCTNRVEIKKYTTFAGFKSTVLTHSIDLKENRQSSKPITIGEYCFIGTGCILLGGAIIPDNCIVAAGSTINKNLDNKFSLYGGSPAKYIKSLKDDDLKYFKRTTGFVT